MEDQSWLLRGAIIIPCDPEQEDAFVGDVAIDGGRISAIGTDLDAGGREELDLRGKLLIPGLIDAHRHTWQTPLRALGADWTVMDYLAAVRERLAPAFTPEDVYAGNLAGALEALDAGVTTLVDYAHVVATPAHANAALEGLEASGIRALFAYGLAPPTDASQAFPDFASRLDDARRVRRERLASDHGLIRMGIALTEMQVPWEQSRAELECARELGVPITLHASPWPVTATSEPRRLEEEGLLGPDLLFVHGTFLPDDDLKRIADAGAALCATPETEMQMGMGFPAHGRALACGARVTLGCDVVASNGGDLFTAMRLALQVERARTNAQVGMPKRLALRARQMLPMVTRDAAAALGLGDRVGRIAVGLDADLVVLGADALNLSPLAHPVDTIVMQAHAGNVQSVMVRGVLHKHQGVLLGSVAEARAGVRRARDGVIARAGGLAAITTNVQEALASWDVGRVQSAQPGSQE